MKRFFVLLSFFLAFSVFAQTNEKILRFKYREGDNYRVLSTVNEVVKVNGRLNHTAEIVNRVSAHISKVDSDNRGYNEATFITMENSTTTDANGTLTYGEEYESKYWRDERGIFEISKEYFMPVVRDVPVLPEKAVKPGDTWTANGHEAHDLRRSFANDEPFKVPFTATYTYLRDEEGVSSDSKHEKKTFQVLSVKYTLSFESPIPENVWELNDDFPVMTMGFSNQTIWWDNEKGQIDHYSEDFRIVMETYLGNQFDFTGKAHAEVTDFERTATDKNLAVVLEKVKDLDLPDVSVAKTEKGLTISVENIQFKPNSAELLDSEKTKLNQIAKIIEDFPNDLLISGHTALSGSAESCQILSEERADSVAKYLIKTGVRDKYHVYTQGFGARVPIASNATPEGMAKNRRVEITILDK
ncbi:MAG: OmpA family protein [Treponema sp.]|uniref:OmpA family protein n=1 Tax=Treponema sp. TaxID=166 RepID=UPI0025E2DEB2|nr:OmpA family protein [Treponema sp.]MBQ9282682.1 OmpA family protein [Treponema sp.]